MWKWIRKLLGLCEHDWVEVEKMDRLRHHYLYGRHTATVHEGYAIFQKCSKCSDHRRIDV